MTATADSTQRERKLSAILCGDAVGYSRLMADDEAATIGQLNRARETFREQVAKHRGRVIDTAGDSVLAAFASPIEAVQSAAEIQRALAQDNAALPSERRMQFRIGINLGDVVEEGGALYGDGVNVAARLQALCDPGGLCISGTVFDQVDGRVPVGFKFIGEQRVKNISKPVRAYRNAVHEPSARTGGRRLLPWAVLAVAAMLVASALVFRPWERLVFDAAAPRHGSDPALAMPSGPSIAVLPFTNMTKNPEEEFFSDGLTEDLITELARFRELHVLARNTTFQYKDQVLNIPEVAAKLGVGYVLEGSVRRTGDRLRITAQLIDGKTGTHIWADRYDRDAKDVFAVQDEITGKVIGAIAGGSQAIIQQAARDASTRKDPGSLEAYELYLRATTIDWFNPAAWAKAKAELERAIQLEPGYAQARQQYAWMMLMGWIFRLGDTGKSAEEVRRDAILSVQLDPSNPRAHVTAAIAYYFDGQLEAFEREASKAFELAPYDADVFAIGGWFFGPPGDWERAERLAEKGFKLNPASTGGWYHSAAFYNHYVHGRYQEALAAIKAHPNPSLCENQMKFLIAYGQLGQPERAREHYARCKADIPDFSPAWMLDTFREWHFKESHIRLFMEGFAKAGYPCEPPKCVLSAK